MNAPPILFADASFYIAAFNVRDEWHARAAAWHRAIVAARSRVITTEAVLWEWLNYYAAPSARSLALRHYHRLHADPLVQVLDFEPDLVQQALMIYGSHPDKSWGLTDCFSFAVMRRHTLNGALTSDHHFEQAGFDALLLGDPQQ
jgi:predicted nucleic acid-binding protein